MTWNYRIIHTIIENENNYDIHEVYYDKDNKIKMWSTDPICCNGATLKELKDDLKMQLESFNKPVLVELDKTKPPTLIEE